ncbi:eukaryotic translation initiation factor 2D [Manduca sexta]|uniref:Ligatin n=1 Tax=Manduca sexta TaxID=7130 RepID=A0A922CWG7_MANSE|nr:eukaryotic translation initiation factor 2D [Manduca sexta]KAG6460942.1 hypothetical protein O3G_MSEX012314 [Manduca sexta]
MFAKPYKLKSNNTLKNSEKKHLVQRIQNEFPSISEEKAKELVPSKSTCSCMKVTLNSGEAVNVYAVDGAPTMIEMADCMVPTVCALWKAPELAPAIVIHSPVLFKIQGGAPLYLPGVVLPASGIGFPLFQRGSIVSVHTSDNSAAAVVGRVTMSSADMLLRAAGVCLDTLHVFGDQLCKDPKFSKIERPKLGPPSYASGEISLSLVSAVEKMSIQPTVKEEWPSLGKQSQPPPQVPNEPQLITEVDAPNTDEASNDVDMEDSVLADESQTELDIPTDMDGLLKWCLLSFIKLEGKSIELPLKTNLFYKNHLMPLCPSDQTLDVKKSSYKKMGKFLEAMQEEALLEVREIERGVSAVVALNLAAPAVRQHRVPPLLRDLLLDRRKEPAPHDTDYEPPVVRELFCLTAALVDLFAPLKKGTALTSSEIRSTVTEYVKAHNLNCTRTKGAVVLDPLLAKIVGKQEQESVKWDELMTCVQNKMTASTEMRFADGSVKLTKAKLEPIKMQVVNRSGNKKVTLVSNLESFGFSLPGLSRACQQAAAASCGVTRSPGASADQLMLQGDQTHFVAKLLIEKYGLPKKFVEGADKALKKKK